MDNNYINFYNNLVDLTRNKILYKDFADQDTFSDRLAIFLFHFAFFLNVFKSYSQKNILQTVFDYIFKQLEISLREIGYGDTAINKRMKSYVNFFYSILNKIDGFFSISKKFLFNILIFLTLLISSSIFFNSLQKVENCFSVIDTGLSIQSISSFILK